MLSVQGLTKRFGKQTAVNNVSFEVSPGDSFGLLGPNGAGKSTTISMMVGLIAPDKGDVSLHGKSIKTHATFIKRKIGLVPQTIAVYGHLTARENLVFWGTVYGISGQKLRDNVDWCLRLAGLTDNEKQRVDHYSGGMKRRLNIAVGLVHRPEILVMDEPTVGIDPQSRNHILETVKGLVDEGMTVIYTSHYMEEVQFLCKRLAIIDHGDVIAYGSLNDVRQLAGSHATVRMEVSGEADAVSAELRQDLMLRQIVADGRTLSLQSTDAAQAVSKAVLALSRHNLHPTRIDVQEPNLEAAFLHLTGRQLRDASETGEAVLK